MWDIIYDVFIFILKFKSCVTVLCVPAGKSYFIVTSGGALSHIVHRVQISVQRQDPGSLRFGVTVHFSGSDWNRTQRQTRAGHSV